VRTYAPPCISFSPVFLGTHSRFSSYSQISDGDSFCPSLFLLNYARRRPVAFSLTFLLDFCYSGQLVGACFPSCRGIQAREHSSFPRSLPGARFLFPPLIVRPLYFINPPCCCFLGSHSPLVFCFVGERTVRRPLTASPPFSSCSFRRLVFLPEPSHKLQRPPPGFPATKRSRPPHCPFLRPPQDPSGNAQNLLYSNPL